MISRLFTTLTLSILVASCSSDDDSSSSTPTLITDTAWAGDCMPATQGTSQAVIAFSGGRFYVRTFLFLGSANCDDGWDRRSAVTTGDYSLGGFATDGISTEIDISNIVYNDPREQSEHDAVTPRDFDVFYIESGLLFYGNYDGSFDGSRDGSRPLTYGTPSVAIEVDIDKSDVF